ncbi:MAG: HDOD domain-containing protein [Candidatus Cloacimonetes bacterium]|nr:HDOD domain-containing protein [Candidatus Cloacimonadota bacterium]
MRDSSPMDLEKLTAEIDHLSTLPDIVFKIMELTNDKNSGADDLVKVIQTDPSITTKVLRMVNAPYYAVANEIYDVKKAIVRLGFRAIREISLTVSVCELFKSKSNIHGYKRSELWRHLVGVAILAKMISERMNLALSNQAFSAGLLHDIGIILMDQYCQDDFIKVMQNSSENKRCVCECEKEVLTFDHQMLSYGVFEKSEIPDSIADVMRYHHQPQNSKEYAALNSLIYIADKLCNSFQIGYVDHCEIDNPTFNYCLNELNIRSIDVKVFVEEFPELLNSAVESYTSILN